MGKAGGIGSLLLIAGCAQVAPPLPAPFHGQPPGPPAELGATTHVEPPAAPPPVATSAPVATANAAVPEAPPPVKITLEQPFRIDKRPIPSTKEAFLADLRDRTAWNKGGMGTLAADPPPVAGHPLPKVIIDVTRTSGALSAAEAQRVLRKMLWMKVVDCYGLGAYKDQKLHGKIDIGFRVSPAGKITGARSTSASLPDTDVVACLAASLHKVELPKARAGTQVAIQIEINHGDEPLPPPLPLITPGEGELDEAATRAVMTEAFPRFEACYRPALAYAPELWGRLGIRFHVTEKGKLDEAFEVESTFPDERVSLCVLRAARGLKLPKAVGGEIRFVVPLRFSNERSPAPVMRGQESVEGPRR